MTNKLPLSQDQITGSNAAGLAALEEDYAALGCKLARSGMREAVQSIAAHTREIFPHWLIGSTPNHVPDIVRISVRGCVDGTPLRVVAVCLPFVMTENAKGYFLEEPTIPEDLAGYARIRAGTSTPIAGSERLTSKFRFQELFAAGGVDIAQPDPVYIGGITELKKVAAIAELHQVVIAPHNTKGPVGIMAAAHVMASIPNALIQEFIAPSWIPWRDQVLTEPLDLDHGRLLVRDRPGLGVTFDQDALRPHLVG